MKKRISKLLLCLFVLLFVITGCSKETEKTEQEKLIEDMTREFEVSDKDSYKNVVAMLIQEEPVYVDEVMWYIFLIEDSMKLYSETYEEGTGESYWEQSVDGNVTMGELYTGDIITQITYNQILSSLAQKDGLKIDEDGIRKEAKEVMSNISKEDIEKYGLTEDAYVKMHIKWELVDQYLEILGEDAVINEEQIRKDNPIESFVGKLNTEFIIVLHTYTDENGEKQILSDDRIDELIAELEKARQDALNGKDMKDVAKDYANVLYFESSFYLGDNSATSIYEETTKKLSVGEVSGVVREALSTYVIKRLDDSKDEDYEEYIESLVKKEEEIYAEHKAKELTEDISAKLNDNVWKTIGIGKNNS